MTADNIFTDIYNTKKLIKLHLNRGAHYSSNHNKYLPKGMGVDIFETSKLIQLKKYNLTKYDQEHLNSYFIRNKKNLKQFFIKQIANCIISIYQSIHLMIINLLREIMLC